MNCPLRLRKKTLFFTTLIIIINNINAFVAYSIVLYSTLLGEYVGCRISSSMCLSAIAVEWHTYCFIKILLHYAPPKVTQMSVICCH